MTWTLQVEQDVSFFLMITNSNISDSALPEGFSKSNKAAVTLRSGFLDTLQLQCVYGRNVVSCSLPSSLHLCYVSLMNGGAELDFCQSEGLFTLPEYIRTRKLHSILFPQECSNFKHSYITQHIFLMRVYISTQRRLLCKFL